jgi:hypothetical protein
MSRKFFNDVELKAGLKLSAGTASRALVLDGSNDVVASSVTSTELGHLSGVTSAIQTQLDAKIPSTEKGAANGVATLDGSGKLPSAQLPTSAMEYKGAHNVSTNSPTLIDGTGTNGDMYRISVGGTRDYGSGNITLAAGDALIYNGSIWEKIPGEDIIQSVNGATGVVVLDTDDISEGATNLYYTDGRFDTRFATKDSADLNHTQADATDWTVASGAAISAHLDELADRMVAVEGGSTDNKDLKVSANDTTAGFLEDKIVVSQGSNTTNILELSTLNDAANEDLQIQIDQSKIDHDSLLNFVADEHVAHSGVSVVAGGQDGLSVSNDNLSSNIGLSVDITGTASAASLENADQVMIHDDSAASLAKTTLGDIRKHSADDILETSFAGAQSAAGANVTGFAFANANVRSFQALVHVAIDATSDLFEEFMIEGIQKASSWEISVSSVGDDTSVTFSISAAGQITYSSSTYAGFVSMDVRFRAITLGL